MNKKKSLPYGYQDIDQDDVEAVANALNNDFLTTGPLVESFENALTKLTKAKFAVSCSSGTSALHLACLALGIKKGDWVIVPSVTFWQVQMLLDIAMQMFYFVMLIRKQVIKQKI